jgi:hypothetical protein
MRRRWFLHKTETCRKILQPPLVSSSFQSSVCVCVCVCVCLHIRDDPREHTHGTHTHMNETGRKTEMWASKQQHTSRKQQHTWANKQQRGGTVGHSRV